MRRPFHAAAFPIAIALVTCTWIVLSFRPIALFAPPLSQGVGGTSSHAALSSGRTDDDRNPPSFPMHSAAALVGRRMSPLPVASSGNARWTSIGSAPDYYYFKSRPFQFRQLAENENRSRNATVSVGKVVAGDRIGSMLQLAKAVESHRRSSEPPSFPDFWDDILDVRSKSAELVIPPEFRHRAAKMFSGHPSQGQPSATRGDSSDTNQTRPTAAAASPGESGPEVDFLESQTVVTARNLVTRDTSLFNEVRRYRPGYAERLPADREAQVNASFLQNQGADTCDFCHGKRVAHDVIGPPIVSEHCYIASNIAKYEGLHGLLVAKEHHPLKISAASVIDYLRTAHVWFERIATAKLRQPPSRRNGDEEDADRSDRVAAGNGLPKGPPHRRLLRNRRLPRYYFPQAMYDAGAKASASQAHQHWQLILTEDSYLGRADAMFRDADAYEYAARRRAQPQRPRRTNLEDLSRRRRPRDGLPPPRGGRESDDEGSHPNFFADWAALHQSLGLASSVEGERDAVVVFPSLTPIKEREIWVAAANPVADNFTAFGKGLHAALAGMMQHGTRAVSMSVTFQPIALFEEAQVITNGTADRKGLVHSGGGLGNDHLRGPLVAGKTSIYPRWPAVARMVDRGSPLDARSDVGAMEFYGGNNVGADPFDVATWIRDGFKV